MADNFKIEKQQVDDLESGMELRPYRRNFLHWYGRNLDPPLHFRSAAGVPRVRRKVLASVFWDANGLLVLNSFVYFKEEIVKNASIKRGKGHRKLWQYINYHSNCFDTCLPDLTPSELCLKKMLLQQTMLMNKLKFC